MIKKIISAFLLSICSYAYSQSGINTLDPKATLDITGKPTDKNVFDGVIPPRITGNQLNGKTYTTAQDGALVYVTVAAANNSLIGQTEFVNIPGLYYFDGPTLKWNYLGTNPISTNFRSTAGQILNLTDTNDQVITFSVNDSNFNLATDFNDANDIFKIKYKGVYQISGFIGYNPNQPAYTNATDYIAVNLKLQKRNGSSTWQDVTGIRFVTVGIQCGVGTAIALPTSVINFEVNDELRLVIQRPGINIGGVLNKEFGGVNFDHVNKPNGQTYTKMLTITKLK